MKNAMLVCTILLLMGSIASAQATALSLLNPNVAPNPVVAGGRATISFELYNSYSASLSNADIQLTGSYPLLNFSPSSSYLIGTVGQGVYSAGGSYFVYNLTIPKTAPSGQYTLDVLATYQTTTTLNTASGSETETVSEQEEMPISIYVHGIPAISITATPSAVTPGGQFTLQASISNSGYGQARNITVTFLNTPNFTSIGGATTSIGLLQVSGATQATVTYLAGQSVQNGTYSIPVQLTYYSETGQKYSQTLYVSINTALNTPNVIVVPVSAVPSALYSGSNQTLTVSIENIGTGVAKNVSVSMLAGPGASVSSAVNNFFLSQLSPSQSVNEQILVTANSTTTGSGTINAAISYSLANGQGTVSKNRPITLQVVPSAQFKVVQLSSNLYPGATDVPITFSVENIGNAPAQQVQFSFQSTYPITPLSSTYYVQDLAPGASTNVTLLVSVDSQGSAANYPVTLYEQWKQPNGAVNQQYSGASAYYAAVNQTAAGPVSNSVTDLIIVVVVVIAVAAVTRRYMAQQKQRGQKRG